MVMIVTIIFIITYYQTDATDPQPEWSSSPSPIGGWAVMPDHRISAIRHFPKIPSRQVVYQSYMQTSSR